MEKLRQIVKGVNNFYLCCVIVVSVLTVLFVLPPILKSTVLNDLNRIYDEYTIITEIKTDYVSEEITITTGSTDWFDVTNNTNTYKLSQIYDNPLFVIDNSVWGPTMIEGVVHLPDTFPR